VRPRNQLFAPDTVVDKDSLRDIINSELAKMSEEDEFGGSLGKREDHDSSSGDGEDMMAIQDFSEEGIVMHKASKFKINND
jgi:hypothetical protein